MYKHIKIKNKRHLVIYNNKFTPQQCDILQKCCQYCQALDSWVLLAEHDESKFIADMGYKSRTKTETSLVPMDTFNEILRQADIKTIARLASTCKTISNMFNDALWKHLLYRDFDLLLHGTIEIQDHQRAYIDYYRQYLIINGANQLIPGAVIELAPNGYFTRRRYYYIQDISYYVNGNINRIKLRKAECLGDRVVKLDKTSKIVDYHINLKKHEDGWKYTKNKSTIICNIKIIPYSEYSLNVGDSIVVDDRTPIPAIITNIIYKNSNINELTLAVDGREDVDGQEDMRLHRVGNRMLGDFGKVYPICNSRGHRIFFGI